MKTQDEINRAWLTKDGAFTFLDCPARNSQLPKPYTFEKTEAEILGLKNELKTALKPFSSLLQCAGIDLKRTGRGFRLDIFMLGFRPAYCNGPNEKTGVTLEQWSNAVDAIRNVLKSLEAEPLLYVEPWIAERKFQARFEAYIFRKL